MSKIAVIYWSQTGNTQAMAEAIVKGAQGAGADVELIPVSEADASSVGNYDVVALGCPAMGAEELEDGEFGPFFDSVASDLAGKKVVLFGSYGWGGGEWMRTWEETCGNSGILLAHESLIVNNTPGDDELAQCEALGAAIAA